MSKAVSFTAHELLSDGTFGTAQYEYVRSAEKQIQVLRNSELHLTLDGDYAIVKTLRCGICSTDLARHFLPYPLPQIIGHEVVVSLVDSDSAVGGDASEENAADVGVDGSRTARLGVVEINDSHLSHGCGSSSGCAYCRTDTGIPSQCPERITFGINQWPGGMAPYVIVPLGNLIPIPRDTLSVTSAVLIEPFAAALHGVRCSQPRAGDSVAVLGAGRLGLLTIAALVAFRGSASAQEASPASSLAGGDDPVKQYGSASPRPFSITAIVRTMAHAAEATRLGADRVVLSSSASPIAESFDVVFDTSGSPDGFDAALRLARREVHLKSTHGQPVLGLQHLTELVVDEMAVVNFDLDALEFAWSGHAGDRRHRLDAVSATNLPSTTHTAPSNPNVLVSSSVDAAVVAQIESTGRKVYRFALADGSADSVAQYDRWIESGEGRDRLAQSGSPFPRFDLVVVTNEAEIDAVMRPNPVHDRSLLRTRGAFLIASRSADEPSPSLSSEASLLQRLAEKRLNIRSSRCGEFRVAIEALTSSEHGIQVARNLERLVTHQFPLSKLPEAFQTAQSRVAQDGSKVIKVVLDCAL
ncbi:uncharacterized protein BJ171DRAFT_258082 [Polychytrium aggregatum]|uniref:uncharacterized protein n=1 Tax=Polychytrium aggregatum TaxID=110093 RepID=UPI0022FE9F39|nr:uncharacterized protein BJ171DRAFT_258082 [Polychytrium aggregatum]KAI9207939.1 hypothetical protein BJ171DRAFT_258082 [Polychytrium aggregatum]